MIGIITSFRYAGDYCVITAKVSTSSKKKDADASAQMCIGNKTDFPFKDMLALKGTNQAVEFEDSGKTVTLKDNTTVKRFYFKGWAV